MMSAFNSYSKEQVPESLPKKELNEWCLTTATVCIFIITDEKF